MTARRAGADGVPPVGAPAATVGAPRRVEDSSEAAAEIRRRHGRSSVTARALAALEDYERQAGREIAAGVDGPARRLLGLSTAHNCPRGGGGRSETSPEVGSGGLYAVAAVGGSCVRLRAVGVYQNRPPEQVPRGEVREFSRASRQRLIQTCASLPRYHVQRGALFVTLTYPGEWPGDWHRWKRDLHTWARRVQRKFPGAALIWKLEPQQRGAPHFHLIVLGVPSMARDWISRTWFEVVGSGDERHLRAGTQVQRVRSHKGVLSYASKYATKGLQELPEGWEGGVGRWWGVYGRDNLGIETAWLPLDGQSFHQVRRALWGVMAARGSRRRGWAANRKFGGLWLMLSDEELSRLVYALAPPGSLASAWSPELVPSRATETVELVGGIIPPSEWLPGGLPW